MSEIKIFTFSEDELKTFVRQVLREWNHSGDEARTINFSVSLAGAFKIASDAKFAAILGKSEPHETKNLVATTTEEFSLLTKGIL